MDDLYIKKVLNGDTEGFRYFITNYKDLAFTVAISVVKDEFWAEEVVQESFIKVFKNLKSFKRRSSFKTWFYRIVINEAFQRIRNEKKEHFYTDNFFDQEPTEENFAGLSAEEQIVLVQESLKRLSPKESLVLRLFYLEEQDTKTVSEETGWSESNIRVILHRGRKNMLAIVQQLMQNEFKTT
ncbi:RNA polymerase sigma factor [Sunxiuqinia indica]|uniref:RNA polymerase sigma factor n=1 Tax=Sunxiuqinia indica TaxID=2692584 RepID=UPI00135AA784|nr:RNA polymerase sigma factor [Sunxiuqinia indica]